MIYSLEDIKHVHLEISSLCNASCPWCPRNFWGYPYNDGYPEVNFTLDNAKQVFKKEFLKQLSYGITINGNFGDAVMNPQTPDIVEYFRSCSSELNINISTNGSARDANFWTRIAHAGVQVEFALDGLEDTHHLYRQNTSWRTVIKNAKIFIEAGGHAVWKMIDFDHNRHQVDACKQMSIDLGFKKFNHANDGRNVAPVFNKHGQLTHCLGNYQGEKNFEILFHSKRNDDVLLENAIIGNSPKPISCKVNKTKSLYIAANGEVYPCCWLGFYPKTYGHGQYHQPANAQVRDLIKNNNALDHDLNECIQWFDNIEQTWAIPEFKDGRLIICNDVCGQKR